MTDNMTPERRAAQITGMFRLDGIHITQEIEDMAAAIIRGDVDAEELIAQILLPYRTPAGNANQGTADRAAPESVNPFPGDAQ